MGVTFLSTMVKVNECRGEECAVEEVEVGGATVAIC